MAQSTPGQRLILNDSLVLDGNLTLNMGVIDGFTNNKETIVLRPAADAVSIGNLNSYISGVLRRKINTVAIDGWYYLPVGTFPVGGDMSWPSCPLIMSPLRRRLRQPFSCGREHHPLVPWRRTVLAQLIPSLLGHQPHPRRRFLSPSTGVFYGLYECYGVELCDREAADGLGWGL